MVSQGLESLTKQLDAVIDKYLTAEAQTSDYQQYIQAVSSLLVEKFKHQADVSDLLYGRSYCIDQFLRHLWRSCLTKDAEHFSLIAVGGYGRAELHPYSDIDLLILYPDSIEKYEENIQVFISCLWDAGLEVGHSVRSLDDCVTLAKNDITIATNLMESRLVFGNDTLFLSMQKSTQADCIWSGKKFFSAKIEEQKLRHLKFLKTSYALEPNIKKSPGALRDIQMVGWVAKRHFQVESIEELVALKFLNQKEYITLQDCQQFLWRLRFALHIAAGKAEDRLLFDHQKPVAELLGIKNEEHLRDVEILMQRYYRVVKTIRELNDMLLQNFSETIVGNDQDYQITTIDDNFQKHGKQIEIRHDEVFIDDPCCLLKLFLHLANHPEIEGIRASTLRRIIMDRELINNDQFRAVDANKALFIDLFRHPNGVGRAFVLMKRYGVLKAYLPAYAKILGQMQYDLFHIYTVDEHTLFVMTNIANFFSHESEELFPLCSKVIKDIPKIELLYLSALFHDIGKGQGGSHSIIGAAEALEFCQQHKLSQEDSELVSWLVKNHLLMSMTAQRKDITDQDVINQFAKSMKTLDNLNYLYLLTVADIRATSPSLWNNWKDSLLQNLYQLTVIALERGLENPKNTNEAIDDAKVQAFTILNKSRITRLSVDKIWARFKDDYFIRNTIERIAWQTTQILHHEKTGPLISIYRHQDSGATEVFVYMPKHANYFTLITTLLYEKNLSIHDANLHSTIDNYSLGSFVIMEVDGNPITSDRRTQSIKKILIKNLRNPNRPYKHLKRNAPHRYAHFDIQTSVSFSISENGKRTLMELVALDKPGLLSRIGLAFKSMNVELHSAKVVTLGEKVEDIFSITDEFEQPLKSKKQQQQLRDLIKHYVESDQISVEA